MPGEQQHSSTPAEPSLPLKSITPAHDRRQSLALLGLVSIPLALASLRLALLASFSPTALWPFLFSAALALLVWRLRSATAPAALLGGLICLLLLRPGAALPTPPALLPSPALLFALITLFLLTFAGTRFRRAAKETIGLAESRHGRRASQIIANLGTAGLCAALGFYPGALAALAEATADTVSSEVGQALGGPTWLLTTFRPVAPGTDGGLSLRGSVAGLLASALVVLAGSHALTSPRATLLVFLCGVAGLLFDSLLGATLERRGRLGNDLVNFSSTAFAAALASLLSPR